MYYSENDHNNMLVYGGYEEFLFVVCHGVNFRVCQAYIEVVRVRRSYIDDQTQYTNQDTSAAAAVDVVAVFGM